MEYGWVMLFILAVMGGIIAYLGDKIGSRVGKRKIVLFGLRPKYTSILITILTGISIAVVTLGVMFVLSQNVRIALFGMHQLQMQKAELEAQREKLSRQAEALGQELADKNSLIASNEELLKQQQAQLDGKNEEIRMTQLDLQQAQQARDDKTRQLSIIQVAMDEAKTDKENAEAARDAAVSDKEKAQSDLAMLEETKKSMMATIQTLDQRIRLLNQTMTNIREGIVVFRAGEVLSSVVLNGGMSEAATRQEVSQAMSQTNTMICRRLGIQDENTILVYIAPDEFEAVIHDLQQSGNKKKLLRVIAAGNIVLGEPTLVHIEMYDNQLVYHRGETVYEAKLPAKEVSGNAELLVLRFLHKVNQKAQLKGMLPDPLTGNVGAVTVTEMFDAISKIKSYNGSNVVLRAVTMHDTYTAGPLGVDIIVEPANE